MDNTSNVVERLREENAQLRHALLPFVDLKAQGREGAKLIMKKLDGFSPVTVTVTKAQMLEAFKSLRMIAAAEGE